MLNIVNIKKVLSLVLQAAASVREMLAH